MGLELKNLMEEAVINALPEIWENIDMCKCEKCRLDTIAISLNHLPPRYIVSQRGEVYSRTDFLVLQKRVDIMIAISNAIHIVKKNPHKE